MWVKLKDYQSGLSVYPLFVKDYISTGTTDIFLDLGNGRLRAKMFMTELGLGLHKLVAK